MKNSKVSSHELVDVLSSKASISKRAAEDFIKTLFSLIEDKLVSGESVKVKNLGTFKLQWNEPRKSVNVQTGREIVLPGYNKVTFSPDEKLKELVNKPFEHLEAIVVGTENHDEDLNNQENEDISNGAIDDDIYDPLKVFSEQAIEIKELISEIQSGNVQSDENIQIDIETDALNVNTVLTDIQSIESELTPKEDISIQLNSENNQHMGLEVEVVENEVVIEVSSTSGVDELIELATENEEEDNIVNDESIIDVAQQSANENLSETNDVLPKSDQTIVSTDETSSPKKIVEASADNNIIPPVKKDTKPKKKSKSWIWITILIVLACLVGAFVFVTPLHEKVISLFSNDQVNDSIATATSQVSRVQTDTIVQADSLLNDSSLTDSTSMDAKDEVDSLQILFDSKREYKEFLASEKLKKGNRLAKISLHYYGSRDFWVYIYEANQSKYPNPDEIPVGSIVKVPKLDPRLIDTSNPRCLEKAKQLHDLYKKSK
jgi:nucleoid DNA-binding protein